MNPGTLVHRTLSAMSSFLRKPARVAGAAALLATPAACATCIETRIHPEAESNTVFCAQYVTEGKLVEAEARAKIAIEYSPKYAEAWNCLGLVEYNRGRIEVAIEDFKRAISYRDDFAEAPNNLGAIFMEQREYRWAEEQFRASLEIDPGYIKARSNLGLALYHQKREDDAREQFLRCLELDPNDCDCRMGIGVVAIAKQDWNDCRAHFGRHTQVCGAHANGWYNLGYCQYQLGRCEEAYSAFMTAIVAKPDHKEARQNLTLAMDCVGKQDSAVERLMAKIRENPGDPELHFKLGALFEDKQQLDWARSEFTNVVKLKPDYKLAYYRLARLYDRIPQTQETVLNCQRFVDLIREEPWAREKEWCVSRVKELQFGNAPR